VTGLVTPSRTCPKVREVPRDPVRTYGDDLAVVTVVRPGTPPTAVEQLLRSVPAAFARPVQVVVADCGAASPPDGVDVVRLGEDVGRAAAVNRAVAGLPGSVGWVALADPGVEWHPGSLDALLAAVRPRTGALGPRLYDPSGAELELGGDVPGVVDVLRDRPAPPPRTGVVGWLSAACLLLRRAALDSVDGFDPRYVGALDDVDLGDRIGRAGWLVARVPTAGATVRPVTGPPALEPSGVARRRYLHDRSPAPARVLLALAGRGPE
jgi:N-acetylglucosaminyl-diphospho-decaprenol L-rhamnosyltransferase